jgi:hypothetical protein
LGHDSDRCRASGFADHRIEVRAATVLRPIGIVDAVVHWTFLRLEKTSFAIPAAMTRANGLAPHFLSTKE